MSSVVQSPRFEVEADHIGFPDEEVMSCEDGLAENHYYRDLRWIELEDFVRIYADEQAALDYDGDLSSDEAFEDLEDNECMVLGLDPGVASAVAALAVIGACPVTSCSGPRPHHYEEYPLVLVWCDEGQLELIREAALRARVDVVGVMTPGILVCTPDCPDVEPMRAFAQQLIALFQER